MKKPSHAQAIAHHLIANTGKWVSLPELSSVTARQCATTCFVVHSRIAELRQRLNATHRIDNRTEQTRTEHGKVTHSFYRITPIT